MTHYTDDEWIEYVTGEGGRQSDEMAARLAECEECRESRDRAMQFIIGLRDPSTWQRLEVMLTPAPPESAGALVARAEELDRERQDARELLKEALASPVAFAGLNIEHDSRYWSSGVVDELCSAAQALRQRHPKFALDVAVAATRIAAQLEKNGSLRSPALMGRTWMELGVSLGVLTRYREAEEAFTKAEAAFSNDPRDETWDLTVTQLNRAIVCSETERLAEAITIAQHCASVFATYGDMRHQVSALIVEGSARGYSADHQGALAIFERVIEISSTTGDDLARARALQNAANAYLELEKFSKAETYYVEALTLWDELAMPVERIRTCWTLGSLAMRTGDYPAAISIFSRTIADFEALGVGNDAALVRLEMAEALAAAGRGDEVPTVVKDTVVTFASERMTRSANIALAYLRDAVATTRDVVPIIRHVRSYLEQLPTSPSVDFTPLR
jgi:tetratricopeptide (TPR) repeat protein